MEPLGKRPERYSLRRVPDFEFEIRGKPKDAKLPVRPALNTWNSPAFQSLLDNRDAIETESELEVRRARSSCGRSVCGASEYYQVFR